MHQFWYVNKIFSNLKNEFVEKIKINSDKWMIQSLHFSVDKIYVAGPQTYELIQSSIQNFCKMLSLKTNLTELHIKHGVNEKVFCVIQY